MTIEIGTKVLSNDEVIGIPWNTEGIVTAAEANLVCPDLFEITFGDKVRYLYESEFLVLEE